MKCAWRCVVVLVFMIVVSALTGVFSYNIGLDVQLERDREHMHRLVQTCRESVSLVVDSTCPEVIVALKNGKLVIGE